MLLFLAIAAGLVTAWLIYQAIRPLTERGVVTADDWARLEDESMELLARRDRLVSELRDLEFEAALDKISARDMRELRVRYETEALALSRKLEEGAEVYGERIAAQVDAQVAGNAQRAATRGASAEAAADAAGPKAPAAAPSADAAALKGHTPAAGPAESGPAVGTEKPKKNKTSEPTPGALQLSKPATEAPPADAPQADAADADALEPEATATGSRCVACAEAMPAGAAFCDRCGAPQRRSCSGCGTANRANAQFCKACGTGLAVEAS